MVLSLVERLTQLPAAIPTQDLEPQTFVRLASRHVCVCVCVCAHMYWQGERGKDSIIRCKRCNVPLDAIAMMSILWCFLRDMQITITFKQKPLSLLPALGKQTGHSDRIVAIATTDRLSLSHTNTHALSPLIQQACDLIGSVQGPVQHLRHSN